MLRHETFACSAYKNALKFYHLMEMAKWRNGCCCCIQVKITLYYFVLLGTRATQIFSQYSKSFLWSAMMCAKIKLKFYSHAFINAFSYFILTDSFLRNSNKNCFQSVFFPFVSLLFALNALKSWRQQNEINPTIIVNQPHYKAKRTKLTFDWCIHTSGFSTFSSNKIFIW